MATTDTTIPEVARTQSYHGLSNGESPSTSSRALSLRREDNPPSRRLLHWPSVLTTALIAVLISPLSHLATNPFSSPALERLDPTDYSGRAREILKTTPVIDGHNDLPYLLRVELQNKIYDGVNLSEKLLGHTDLGRMQQGHMGGQFWSVWIECEPTPFTEDAVVSLTINGNGEGMRSDRYGADLHSRHLRADRCDETHDPELLIGPSLL